VNSNECWLVDVGDVQPVFDNIPEQSTIKGIFLTHTHYDHLYGINKIVELYPDCITYTSEHGRRGLFSDKLNFSRYHDDPIVFSSSNIHILYNGNRIELLKNVCLNVIETPGHDLSCLTYYTEKEIFSGDSFIPGVKIVTSFPHSNKVEAEISRERILQLAIGRNLYPGHGNSVMNFK
jgi:glyoxylase-like metal-dependent hydrolase (beta-lactamase superfamily II)